MKNQLYVLSLLILILSCQSKTETRNKTPTIEAQEMAVAEVDTKTEVKIDSGKKRKEIEKIKEQKNKDVKSETEELAKLILDNESDFSKEFINKLRAANGMEEIEFSKGVMILNQKDSIDFPEIPIINRTIKFTGRQENLAIALTIKRINYTSIEYTLEMVEFGKLSKTTNGIADLGGFFFFGSESDTDELSKESYFSTEFSNTIDSCYTNIRIGNTEDSNDYPLLAKIVKNCNGKIMNIDLENFPVLREK